MLPEVIYQAVPAKLYFSLAADKAAHGIKIYSALVRRRKTTEKEKRETRSGRLQKIYFFCCCAVTTCAPCAVYFLYHILIMEKKSSITWPQFVLGHSLLFPGL
jgi:hypothetical protein